MIKRNSVLIILAGSLCVFAGVPSLYRELGRLDDAQGGSVRPVRPTLSPPAHVPDEPIGDGDPWDYCSNYYHGTQEFDGRRIVDLTLNFMLGAYPDIYETEFNECQLPFNGNGNTQLALRANRKPVQVDGGPNDGFDRIKVIPHDDGSSTIRIDGIEVPMPDPFPPLKVGAGVRVRQLPGGVISVTRRSPMAVDVRILINPDGSITLVGNANGTQLDITISQPRNGQICNNLGHCFPCSVLPPGSREIIDAAFPGVVDWSGCDEPLPTATPEVSPTVEATPTTADPVPTAVPTAGPSPCNASQPGTAGRGVSVPGRDLRADRAGLNDQPVAQRRAPGKGEPVLPPCNGGGCGCGVDPGTGECYTYCP